MPTTVLVDGLTATECPRWHQGELFFSDMHGHAVLAVTEDGERRVVAAVPGTPGGLGWLPDGRLLVVAQRDRTVLRLEGDTLVVHADLSALCDSALNDMWVDEHGNAYVGEMGFDVHAFFTQTPEDPVEFREGRIFRVAPDGSVSVAASSFKFPNGIVCHPTSGDLLVAESFGFQVSSLRLVDDLALEPVGTWAVPFAPDGLAVDAEGHVWVADPAGQRAVRLSPGGEIEEEVVTDRQVLSVALGGSDGRTLFLCTTPTADPVESVEVAGGRIETARVAVAGVYAD